MFFFLCPYGFIAQPKVGVVQTEEERNILFHILLNWMCAYAYVYIK